MCIFVGCGHLLVFDRHFEFRQFVFRHHAEAYKDVRSEESVWHFPWKTFCRDVPGESAADGWGNLAGLGNYRTFFPLCHPPVWRIGTGYLFDWVLTGSLLVVLPLLASFVFYVRYGLKNPVSCMRFYQAGKSKSVYRQIFLFIQYAITLLLIILAFYFQHHFDFLMHTPHGYTTQGILSADLYRENSYSAYESLTSEQQQRQWACREAIDQKLDECPFIESWMSSSRDFLRGYLQI